MATREEVEGIGWTMTKIAACWTLTVSIGLLAFVLVNGIGIGALILLMPLAAATIALFAPRSVGGLVLASLLLVPTVILGLIGWWGFLYLPPLVMLVVAAARASRGRGRPVRPGTGPADSGRSSGVR